MQLSDARDELLARGYHFLEEERATRFLNWAGGELSRKDIWPWDESTIVGTAPLLISDLRAILSVTDTTNDTQLWGMDRQALAVTGNIAAAGTSCAYYLEGNALKLYPTSSVVLEVQYVRRFTTLTADTDTPRWPVDYDDLWIDLAVLRAMKDDDDMNGYQTLQAVVDRAVQDAQAQEEMRRLDRSDSVVSVRRSEG